MELVEPGYAMVDESGLVGLAGVCRTKYDKVDPGVLDVMVMPYYSEHRWNWIGAVYASDICQLRDSQIWKRTLGPYGKTFPARLRGYIGHRPGQTFLPHPRVAIAPLTLWMSSTFDAFGKAAVIASS